MKAIIVDDNKLECEVVEAMLKRHRPDIKIEGICNTSEAAIELIGSVDPELIFMDITIDHRNGFQILKEVEYLAPDVIFITNRRQHYFKAFKISGVPCLVKPFTEEHLLAAVDFVEQMKKETLSPFTYKPLMHNIANEIYHEMNICFRAERGKLIFFKVKEIGFIKAAGNNSVLYNAVEDKLYPLSDSIKDAYGRIKKFNFYHSKSYLINIDNIDLFTKISENESVLLIGKQEIEFGRKITTALNKLFSSGNN